MIGFVVFWAFFAIVVVGAVVLQVFFSRAESRWPGLILPGISFLFSLLLVFGYGAYSINGSERVEVITDDGMESVVTYIEPEERMEYGVPWGAISVTLLVGNIPTLILMGVYVACRGGRSEKKEMEKMSIQDLE